MNIKLKNQIINPEYSDLFRVKSDKEKVEHNAEMISFRILSEVEKICEEKQINKTELAKRINTSKSYVTQLFRGSKQVNTFLMGKLEEVLDISFEIKAKLNEDSKEDFIAKQIPSDYFDSKRRIPRNSYVLYVIPGDRKRDRTKEFMDTIYTESKTKQKAG